MNPGASETAGYPFKLMLMTGDPEIAGEAERAGVDRIFVDLERLGKAERQAGRATIISNHTIEDVAAIRAVLTRAELLVRIDPPHPATRDQVEAALQAGADVIMMPMFCNREEVACFVDAVNGRATTCLLLETPAAAVRVDQLVSVAGVDEVHVGLNDLHIGLGLDAMHESLAGGLLDHLAWRIRTVAPRVVFGFGGGARISAPHPVPPADILAEHVRLGSRMIILSRTFVGAGDTLAELRADMDLAAEVRAIRSAVAAATERTAEQVEGDRCRTRDRIWQMAEAIRARRRSLAS